MREGAGHTQRQEGPSGLACQGRSGEGVASPPGPSRVLAQCLARRGALGLSKCAEGVRGTREPAQFVAGERPGQICAPQKLAWGTKGARAWQGFGMGPSGVWLQRWARGPWVGVGVGEA